MRETPVGKEEGYGEGATPKSPIGIRPVFVKLINTNSSPLWGLKPQILSDKEALKPASYFKKMGAEKGAYLIIYLGQMDGESGILMISEEGDVL
jgi:hypothetical protein